MSYGKRDLSEVPLLFKIPRCYDSHLHLTSTGEMASTLELSSVRKAADFSLLDIKGIYRRQDWLVGWGFDDTQWSESVPLNRQTLDKFFPEIPVAFTRRDGHVLWLNTAAFKKLGFLKPKENWEIDLLPYIDFGADGLPTGSLKDRALDLVLFAIPKSSDLQVRSYFEIAFTKMLKMGFTHVREMMTTPQMWQVLLKMEEARDLRNYVELNFHCPHLDLLDETISVFKEARRTETLHLRPAAIKIFIDGALGSSGAFLNKDYEDSAHQGTLLWPAEQIKETLHKAWKESIPVSLHTLGDGASLVALQQAQSLRRQNVVGQLHLEHVEVMSDSAVELMKDLDVVCHIQPSHFLTDKEWLKKRLGSRIKDCFPWKRLEKAGVPFYFGSDTPIEPPDLKLTLQGLKSASDFGIPSMQMDWTFPHSHPDTHWGSKCWTEISRDAEIIKVVVDGEPIF